MSQLKELQPGKSRCLFIATQLAKFRNRINTLFLHESSKYPSVNINRCGNNQTGEKKQKNKPVCQMPFKCKELISESKGKVNNCD